MKRHRMRGVHRLERLGYAIEGQIGSEAALESTPSDHVANRADRERKHCISLVAWRFDAMHDGRTDDRLADPGGGAV